MNKIESLQNQINQLKSQQATCTHEWGEVKYDPETIKVPYGSKNVGQGSDPWFVPEGYTDQQKARWKRVCKKCEKEEFTYDKKPVIKEYVPNFR